VPYRITTYTANVYPTKLNEYLALGIPVVATDLEEIRRFNAEHGDVVGIAADAERFAAALQQAIEKSAPADVERRIDVARQNSWEARIPKMMEAIEHALSTRSAHTAWEDRLRRVYRVARRRLARVAVPVIGAWMLLFYTPFVWLVAEPLKQAEPPRRADAIVVFAGGVGESGKAGGGYQERVKHAADLYKSGYASRVVLVSGFVFALREAEVMQSLAEDLGVPARDIVLEQRASTTREYVEHVRETAGRAGWRSILLVSSPYHMRRAVGTFRKAAPGIEVTATPPPMSQFYAHETGASFEQIAGVGSEYAALAYYTLKGWL